MRATRDTDFQALSLDFLTANLMLGDSKPLPRPADVQEPHPGAFQHGFSGTGYRETGVARKPWWRFWR